MKRFILFAALAFTAVSPALGADADGSFDCVMNPSLRVNLGSQIPGLLDQVLVNRGDHVVAGQVVARLKSEVEAAQVALDRTRATGTAEIEARQAQATLTRRSLARSEDLLAHQVATAQHVDELTAQAEIAERELRLAVQSHEVVKLEQLRSEAYLRQREIRSPIDGIVTERIMTAGEYAHQEAVILRLASVDPLYVETFLPVKLYPLLRVGVEAVVEPMAPTGQEIPAKVTLVDQLLDAASGTFGVRLEVPNVAGKLLAGSRCRVRFQLDE
ncbi:MAG: rane fusion protein multidrug efflux system [Acetobacteraceae bacterium]|jgi:RND family efflux transporter MFP subunit|nr:rane fusion protein multidrug efflux system [Acetobacteraceae bacterium]